jgi:peptidoglycan-associated lipoprotein
MMRASFPSILAAALFAAACGGSKPPEEPAPEPTPAPVAEPAPVAVDSSAEMERRRREAEAAAAAERAKAIATDLATNINFDYDQSAIRTADQGTLDRKAAILVANPGVTLRIAGHADERGSDEYNLALGQRRASSVKAYLVQHGIAEARVQTISYGEERPMAQGTDESAYGQNRRAEFDITSGPQTLRKP